MLTGRLGALGGVVDGPRPAAGDGDPRRHRSGRRGPHRAERRTRSCSSCSTGWTAWTRTPTSSSSSRPTAPICSSRRSPRGPAGSTRRSSSRCPMPSAGGGCSSSTARASTHARREEDRWSHRSRASSPAFIRELLRRGAARRRTIPPAGRYASGRHLRRRPASSVPGRRRSPTRCSARASWNQSSTSSTAHSSSRRLSVDTALRMPPWIVTTPVRRDHHEQVEDRAPAEIVTDQRRREPSRAEHANIYAPTSRDGGGADDRGPRSMIEPGRLVERTRPARRRSHRGTSPSTGPRCCCCRRCVAKNDEVHERRRRGSPEKTARAARRR